VVGAQETRDLCAQLEVTGTGGIECGSLLRFRQLAHLVEDQTGLAIFFSRHG
jgi:hypothetical protein